MPHIIQHHLSFVNTQMMLYEREFAGNYDVQSERGARPRTSALSVVSGVASRTTFCLLPCNEKPRALAGLAEKPATCPLSVRPASSGHPLVKQLLCPLWEIRFRWVVLHYVRSL